VGRINIPLFTAVIDTDGASPRDVITDTMACYFIKGVFLFYTLEFRSALRRIFWFILTRPVSVAHAQPRKLLSLKLHCSVVLLEVRLCLKSFSSSSPRPCFHEFWSIWIWHWYSDTCCGLWWLTWLALCYIVFLEQNKASLLTSVVSWRTFIEVVYQKRKIG